MVETKPLTISKVEVSQRAKDYLAAPRPMLINGEWVNAASGKTFPSTILPTAT